MDHSWSSPMALLIRRWQLLIPLLLQPQIILFTPPRVFPRCILAMEVYNILFPEHYRARLGTQYIHTLGMWPRRAKCLLARFILVPSSNHAGSFYVTSAGNTQSTNVKCETFYQGTEPLEILTLPSATWCHWQREKQTLCKPFMQKST